MAAKSPGQAIRPRKPKEGTKSHKTHTWEPFTKRISRLKIDPIHDVSTRETFDEVSDYAKSHFRTALDEWAELNLTTTFSSFLKKADPLTENLPQLLHHADAIFDLLFQHIQKKDVLALEPLLSLIAHFARDLGRGFEKYFAQTISLVAEVAATHDAAHVVEWSFTSIAWLFKYLSRLLVQELRPLLEIMKPYLSARKDYIARFSAESLAFLLRKAMGLYPKRRAPLTNAIKALLENVAQESSPQENPLGLLTLLVESCLGTEGNIHSAAEHLVECLLDVTNQMGNTTSLRDLLEGYVVGVVHRTDSVGFEPIANGILNAITTYSGQGNDEGLGAAVLLIRAAIGTRKGSRIRNWTRVLSVLGSLYQSQPDVTGQSHHRQALLSTSALIIQYAPVSEFLPLSNTWLEACSVHSTPPEFFAFCTLVAELGKGRFQEFVLPILQQYLVSRYAQDEIGLTYLLEHLRSHRITCSEKSKPGFIHSSVGWEKSIVERLGSANGDGIPDDLLAGFARLTHNTGFPVQSDARDGLSDVFATLVSKGLTSPDEQMSLRQRITVGWLFEAFAYITRGRSAQVWEIWEQVLQTHDECFRLRPFLDACVHLTEDKSPSLILNPTDRILDVLTNNVMAPSFPLKLSSLRFIQKLGLKDPDQWLKGTVELLLEIGLIEYSPANTRRISMLLRHLPQRQRQVASVSWMQRLIPFFCLGLLSTYHDQTRRDLCTTLGEMLEDSPIQDTIFDILSGWLRSPPLTTITPTQKAAASRRLTPFECSNLNSVREASIQAFEMFVNSTARMHNLADEVHQLAVTRAPENGRALALEVLISVPTIAERRSRMITPVFLDAQFDRSFQDTMPRSGSSATSQTLSPELPEQEWAFSDRRALLKLFGEFQNPKVLFRASEVHDKLMDLLRSGNADTRKLALNAILKWKDPVLQKHETTLFQVIEEKTASAEIGVMLNAEAEENPVHGQERSVFLPVFLRLLYGSIVGRSGTYGSQEARRKTILRMLFRMEKGEVELFLSVAIGRLTSVRVGLNAGVSACVLGRDLVPIDQQYGLLRLMLSLLETLQSQFALYGKNVIDCVLYCTLRACRLVEEAESKNVGILRNIRRTGLQCLEVLFQNCPGIDWESYIPILFAEAISPRMATLSVETAQGVSAMLRMFSVWSQTDTYIPFFSQYDKRLPLVLWQCLTVPSVRPEVQVFILQDVLLHLLERAEEDGAARSAARELLSESLQKLLQNLASVLEARPTKDVLSASTLVILALSPLAATSSESDRILQLLLDILADTKSKIPPAARSSVLHAIRALLQSRQAELEAITGDKLLHVTASLFNYFKDSTNRLSLSAILELLSASDGNATEVALICRDMNAASDKSLNEVDYDRRLQAFSTIMSLSVEGISSKWWEPIVYNMLFFAKDEDFTIRSNAVSALKDFISRATTIVTSDARTIVSDVILPAIRTGVKENSEVVRADMISVFGLLVHHLEDQTSLQDLKPLLVDNDEEASFFNNILHIQQHRRSRAIHRLTSEVEQGNIKPANVAHFFIPLLMKFVKDQSADESTQSIKGQSLQAMRILLKWIDWKQFKTFFKQTKQELEAEEHVQKTAIKILVLAAEALSQAWGQSPTSEEGVFAQCYLATCLPPQADLAIEVKDQLLTKLADFIHYRDEAEMSARLPAAIVAVHLIKLLPSPDIPSLAAPIVLDVSNVLRSKALDSRDAARKCLTDTVTLLGPGSVLFVLKELRNALKRGYQLHVLSYTLHSILVTLSSSLKIGELDYCLQELVAVVMDDIFGIVGQEKENQDYISSMKEVKSSKSFDSMELLARTASMGHLALLLDPIITVLTGSLTSKQMRHIDDLLRRIGTGLARNPAAGERDVLTFAYQAIQRFYKEKSTTPPRQRTQDERNRDRFLIKHVSDTKANAAGSSPLLYKIASFAMDNVRSALQKHGELLTPENVHGFLPIIGDALVEGQEEVKVSALRLLSAMIKLRMPELDTRASLYVIEAIKVVRNANSTNDEPAQAALKLVAAMLRERKTVAVRESDVAELLRRITPDLEEPDRQGVTFNFIRAVMSRKFQVPELYELVDKIGVMMVTNQTKEARDVARGVYVHFLLEYPQSPARWTKQQKYLIKNLEYIYPEGRESVMEAVNMLLSKSSGDILQQLVVAFFVPTVLLMANDEHRGCRDFAGALLGQTFRKAAVDKRSSLLELLRSWSDQKENISLTKISMQAYGILFDFVSEGLEVDVKHVKQSISFNLHAAATGSEEESNMLHQTLQLMLKLAESRPASVLNQTSETSWTSVQKLLQYRNTLVQRDAASIIAAFFRSCKSSSIAQLPLKNIHGLKLNAAEMQEMMKATVRLLKRSEGDEGLGSQAVSNLSFLGRCIDANCLTMPIKATSGSDEDVNDDVGGMDDRDDRSVGSIPAIQYLLDQCSIILREEVSPLTSASLLPKTSTLSLLKVLIPHLSSSATPLSTVRKLLVPLVHLTDTNTVAPRSADVAFNSAYTALVTSGQEIMDTLQLKVGDQAYIKAMTEVSKIVRERREERRRKRVIERVAEPERAAQLKRKKLDRKRDKNKEISKMMGRRRKGLD